MGGDELTPNLLPELKDSADCFLCIKYSKAIYDISLVKILNVPIYLEDLS